METRTLQWIADRSLAFAILLSFVMLMHHMTVPPGSDHHGIWLVINVITGCLLVAGLVTRSVAKRRLR